jgi:hypothetical protein
LRFAELQRCARVTLTWEDTAFGHNDDLALVVLVLVAVAVLIWRWIVAR